MSNKLCRNCCCSKEIVLWVGIHILILMFVLGIAWSTAWSTKYVQRRNTLQPYTATQCLILNYTSYPHSCDTCDKGYCIRSKCFDERFEVSYTIANGTSVTTVFAPNNQEYQHQQQQINKSYECFYQKEDAIFVIWVLPNGRTELINLCIGFGLLGFPILLIFIWCFRLMAAKFLKNCSCTSIIYRIGKRIRHPLKTQSTATLNTSADITMTNVV